MPVPSCHLQRSFARIALSVPAWLALSGVVGAAEPLGSGKLIPHWGDPVWSDEFNVDGLPNPVVWGYQLARRNVIGEKQYYTNRPENVRVEGGALVLELRKDNAIPAGARDWQGSYAGCGGFTSGFIYSKPANRTFLFGRIEFRAKVPVGKGCFPALWTTGEGLDWPKGGEIDVMELWAGKAKPELPFGYSISSNAHWFDERYPGTDKRSHGESMIQYSVRDPSADWHLYAMEWDAKGIKFFIDDVYYAYADIAHPLRSELSTIRSVLRLNHAFDGAADSTVTNQKMYVDYVREFQLRSGVRVHALPSVNVGGNYETGPRLQAFTNQPLPIVGTVSGDGMPGMGFTHEWVLIGGPGVGVIADPLALQTTVTFPVAGRYRIRLTAHDGQYGISNWRDVDVVDGIGNTAPIASSPDRTVKAGYAVKLKATVVDDGLPGTGTGVTWGVWGTAPVTFSSTTVAEPTVTFASAGSYVLTVQASDGALSSNQTLVRVTVVNGGTNQVPQVVTGAPLTVNLGDTITLPGKVTDDGLPEYCTSQQWTLISGPTDPTIAHPTWVRPAATFTAGGTYVLRLTATDGAASASSDLTVNVSMSGTTPR